jgi:peptidylprolyl isomerase
VKLFGLIVILCISLALTACGDDDSSAQSKGSEAAAPAPSDDQIRDETPSGDLPTRVSLTKPDLEPPDEIPTGLVIRDISTGVPPVVKVNDELAIEYHGIDETGEALHSSWDEEPPFQLRFRLGDGKYFAAFEEGIEGMKLGARREMLIPAKLTEKQGNLFYIIDLLEINRQGRCLSTQSLRYAGAQRKAKINDRCDSRVRVF